VGDLENINLSRRSADPQGGVIKNDHACFR